MSASASDAVRRQWGRQVAAEYRSSALTQELTLWLTRLGASPDLVDCGLRIASDELDHARLSHETYLAAGGQSTTALDRANLGITTNADEPLEQQTLTAAVTIFCLGETVAVPLFRHMRQRCDVTAARAALDKIVRDEPRHSSFGWDLLDWLMSGPCAGHEAQIAQVLPTGFSLLERAYGSIEGPAEPPMPDEDRAWGLAPRAEYAEILHSTFARIWEPRFAAHGIDATAAWESRDRAVPD